MYCIAFSRIPHYTKEEITVQGYTIPKGTVLFANILKVRCVANHGEPQGFFGTPCILKINCYPLIFYGDKLYNLFSSLDEYSHILQII